MCEGTGGNLPESWKRPLGWSRACTGVYTFVRNQRPLNLKCTSFILCSLYFKKVFIFRLEDRRKGKEVAASLMDMVRHSLAHWGVPNVVRGQTQLSAAKALPAFLEVQQAGTFRASEWPPNPRQGLKSTFAAKCPGSSYPHGLCRKYGCLLLLHCPLPPHPAQASPSFVNSTS